MMQKQNETLIKQISGLQEGIAVLTQQRFGRKTEKLSEMPGQLSLTFDPADAINEAEAITDGGIPEEPEMETVIIRRKSKTKGKREADLSGMETIIEPTITIPEERLLELFPKGYHRLPDEVYKDLEYQPAKFVVHEHHIAVYAGNGDTGVVRADRLERLLKNSILTPSLAAAIFEEKYVNHCPYNRLEASFKCRDANISRQNMAGWMIYIYDRYLRPMEREFHRELLKSRLIHCDETPFRMPDNGRGPTSRDYMWVYHTCERYGSPPIFIYDYQPTRKAENPRNFLDGYEGILMTDGYQVYHTLAGERPDELKVAGCWAHAKRKFAEIVKSAGAKTAGGTIADKANRRIAAIYHVDNMYKESSLEERLDNRKNSVKPLVDEYFTWLKSLQGSPEIDQSSKTAKAIHYSINQEPYLRLFLTDAMIPLDNNDAERSIRAFCIGKKNWQIIDSKQGAKASAMYYSIAETVKANGLKPHEYFQYVLEQMLLHLDDKPEDYISDLVPWSDKLPKSCKKRSK
nr:IS66 family transposase [uncultured Acetatifactor sp.]